MINKMSKNNTHSSVCLNTQAPAPFRIAAAARVCRLMALAS
jgi:hypothetical protein